MKKILRTAKLDEAAGQVLFCCQRNFLIQLLQIEQFASYLIIIQIIQIILVRGAALITC